MWFRYLSFIILLLIAFAVLPGCRNTGAETAKGPAATVAVMPAASPAPQPENATALSPPETVIVERIIDRVIEKEVERIIKEYVTPVPLREFASVAELRSWCEAHIAVILVPDERGIIDLKNPVASKKTDCDDYAERLQRLAIADGYLMSEQLVHDGMLFGVTVTPEKGYHTGNMTIIGNGVYFIEPQPSIFRIVKVCERD